MKLLEALELVHAMSSVGAKSTEDHDVRLMVHQLILETRQAEKDPVQYAMDFLREHGCFVAMAVSAGAVLDEFCIQAEDAGVTAADLSGDDGTPTIMQAIQDASDEAWHNEPSPVRQVFEKIIEDAAKSLLPPKVGGQND